MGYFVANPTSDGTVTTASTGTDFDSEGAFVAVVDAELPLEAFAASFSLRVVFLVCVDAVPFPESAIASTNWVTGASTALVTADAADLESSNSKKYPDLLFLEGGLDTPSIADVFLPKSPLRKLKMPPTMFLRRLIMPLMEIAPDVSNALRRSVRKILQRVYGIRSDRNLAKKISFKHPDRWQTLDYDNLKDICCEMPLEQG